MGYAVGAGGDQAAGVLADDGKEDGIAPDIVAERGEGIFLGKGVLSRLGGCDHELSGVLEGRSGGGGECDGMDGFFL